MKSRSVKMLTVVEKECSINVIYDQKIKTSVLQLIESSQPFLSSLFKHLCYVFIVLISQSLLPHSTLISRYSWYS